MKKVLDKVFNPLYLSYVPNNSNSYELAQYRKVVNKVFYIGIIGLDYFDYLDLCDILGNDWCRVLDRHDDLAEVDVSVDTETVELKVLDKIWLRKGSKIADIESGHFVKIEIM